jgi:hypothetical protein
MQILLSDNFCHRGNDKSSYLLILASIQGVLFIQNTQTQVISNAIPYLYSKLLYFFFTAATTVN